MRRTIGHAERDAAPGADQLVRPMVAIDQRHGGSRAMRYHRALFGSGDAG